MNRTSKIFGFLSIYIFLLLKITTHTTTATLDWSLDATEFCPDVNCTGETDGVLVADPTNCHEYYYCNGDEAYGPIDCPDGYFFNWTGADCQPLPPGQDCKPCGDSSSGGSCTFECTVPDAKMRVDRYDCSTYYVCNSTIPSKCQGDTPYFDGATCQEERSKCCNCKPYCYKGDTNGKKVLDPKDCTRYYYCFEDQEVPKLSGHCTDGNFDPVTGQCTPLAPCIVICKNLPGEDGCIDRFTCEESGYFAACPEKCDARYYYCSATDIGNTVAAKTCQNGLVFNPATSQCVSESNCKPST